MKSIKKLFKGHSPYLIGLTIFEIVLSIITTASFVYSDRLLYSSSEIISSTGTQKLIESLYSQTWWALILFTLAFIAILSLTSIIYKKLDYLFMSISGWVLMFILAFNINESIVNNMSVILLFFPIMIINIIAYKSEKRIINKEKKKEIIVFNKNDKIIISIFMTLIICILLFLIYAFGFDKSKTNETKKIVTTTTTTTTVNSKTKIKKNKSFT